jgi:hypothetical protein
MKQVLKKVAADTMVGGATLTGLLGYFGMVCTWCNRSSIGRKYFKG